MDLNDILGELLTHTHAHRSRKGKTERGEGRTLSEAGTTIFLFQHLYVHLASSPWFFLSHEVDTEQVRTAAGLHGPSSGAAPPLVTTPLHTLIFVREEDHRSNYTCVSAQDVKTV